MRTRALLGVGLAIALAAAAPLAWWAWRAGDAPDAADAAEDGPLPLPPLPPRIAQGERYDRCLSMVADDPRGVEEFAAAWDPGHQDDGAMHCLALARIALGDAVQGAVLLQSLADGGRSPGVARAVLYDQAAQAWLIAEDPSRALAAGDAAVALSPGAPDLLMTRATAAAALGRWREAARDLTGVLDADPNRPDALALRSTALRQLGRLDEAEDDVDRALALDPEDAEALLQRGILRQRRNDTPGARADWERAVEVAPDSPAADLAQQNLALLEAGPAER